MFFRFSSDFRRPGDFNGRFGLRDEKPTERHETRNEDVAVESLGKSPKSADETSSGIDQRNINHS